jgi:hypothetical protein
MADDVDAVLECAFQGAGVCDVEQLERRVLGNVLPLSGRQVVDDQHVVAAGDECIRHVRSDEPGSSCYENACHCVREYARPRVG